MNNAAIAKNLIRLNSNILKQKTKNANCEILNLKTSTANTSTTTKSTANAAPSSAVKSNDQVGKNIIGEKSEIIFKREDKYG